MANVELAATGDGTVDLVALEAVDVIGDGAIDHGLRVVATPVAAGVSTEAWLSGLAAWHQACREPIAIVMDTALAFLAVLGATASLATALLGTALMGVAGICFGIWKRRTAPEAQGVSWLLLPLARSTITAGVLLRLALPGTHDRRAATAIVAMFFSLAAVRAIQWQVIAAARRRGFGLQPTLVVGPIDRVAQIEHRMRTFPESGLRFDASYSPLPSASTDPSSGHVLVDGLLARHDSVRHVLCVADDVDDVVFKDFVRFGAGRVDVSGLLPLSRLSTGDGHAHLGDLAIIPVQLQPSWGSLMAKRIFDLTAAALLIVLTSPVLALAAIVIRLESPGPVIFKQQRVGYKGVPFTIYKFRSMIAGAESMQGEYMHHNVHESLLFKMERDPRVTRFGDVIRRLSIDELPQLFNVLKGDMSLVGPRPLAADPCDFDTGAQIRHQVLPGITGLWQVHGANALPYADMVELDLTYVATRSLGTDLVLLLKTIPALLVRRGPY